jgi:hypothetical protein
MNHGDGLRVRDYFREQGYKSGWRMQISLCRLIKENRKTIDVQFFYNNQFIDRIDRIPKSRITGAW